MVKEVAEWDFTTSMQSRHLFLVSVGARDNLLTPQAMPQRSLSIPAKKKIPSDPSET